MTTSETIQKETAPPEGVITAPPKERVATATLAGVRSEFQAILSNGLTPARLGRIISDVTQGASYDFLRLAEELEERNGHYRSVLQTRKLAVMQLPWEIESADENDAQAEAMADFVRAALPAEVLDPMRMQSLDGIAKGWGVCEIEWSSGDQWVPLRFIPRPAHYFTVDRLTQRQVQLRTDAEQLYGEPLPANKFTIHTPTLKSGSLPRSGIAFAVAVYHLLRNYAVKDWMAFAEVFGMPIRLGKHAASASNDEKRTLRKAVKAIGSDTAAIIADSMEIELLGTGQTAGGEFFGGLTDWLNKEVSKIVLGQTMTTEDGSSLAQAKVHEDVREDIRNADAVALARTIDRDVIRPMIDLNFGIQEAYPRFVIDTSQAEDVTALAVALPPFMDRGLTVSESQLRERLGLVAPESEEDTLGAKPEEDTDPPQDGEESPNADDPDPVEDGEQRQESEQDEAQSDDP